MANSPFGQDDKTVLRPTPGGRGAGNQSTPLPTPQPAFSGLPADLLTETLRGDQSDSFLALAAGILTLAARLRVTVSYADVNELKQKLVKEVSEFEKQALAKGLQQEKVRIASYVLCTFLDETIQNTPWGAQSNWGHQSLLILFHKEAFGGERFFQIIDSSIKMPAQNLQLIEFFYVLLSLGFEGKFRLIPDGLNALERQRQSLYHLIRNHSGEVTTVLSTRWQGQTSGKTTLFSSIPLWVFVSAALVLLLFCYLGFAYFINSASDPVYKQLVSIAREPVAVFPAKIPALPLQPEPIHADTIKTERFKPLLEDEIAKNMVEVIDDRILRIRNSFASGSDTIKPEFLPMLKKIAGKLDELQTSIVVTGYTDDKPIISARFPSNWHLSVSRAKNVLAVLLASAHLPAARADGLADADPLVANDSPEHRAFNRRVEILVK